MKALNLIVQYKEREKGLPLHELCVCVCVCVLHEISLIAGQGGH